MRKTISKDAVMKYLNRRKTGLFIGLLIICAAMKWV